MEQIADRHIWRVPIDPNNTRQDADAKAERVTTGSAESFSTEITPLYCATSFPSGVMNRSCGIEWIPKYVAASRFSSTIAAFLQPLRQIAGYPPTGATTIGELHPLSS